MIAPETQELYFGCTPDIVKDMEPTLKTRVLLYNKEGNMLIQEHNGILMLPGGKVEDIIIPGSEARVSERLHSALAREVWDETTEILPIDDEVEHVCTTYNYEKYYPYYDGNTVEHFVKTYYFKAMVDFALDHTSSPPCAIDKEGDKWREGQVKLTRSELNGKPQETIEINKKHIFRLIDHYNRHYHKRNVAQDARWEFMERELTAVMCRAMGRHSILSTP
jgi:8-oxo-dGTP pyrophosphatase MutT (NUDIX family)